jgi:hypothetical protein
VIAAVGTALACGGVYALTSWLVGDIFPFSRYAMYAGLRGRTEGAVLYVRVGEAFVDVQELLDFDGVDPAKIQVQGWPCSQEWQVVEARRWVEAHPGSGREAVEVGFRVIRVREGAIEERLVPVTTGRARRAR